MPTSLDYLFSPLTTVPPLSHYWTPIPCIHDILAYLFLPIFYHFTLFDILHVNLTSFVTLCLYVFLTSRMLLWPLACYLDLLYVTLPFCILPCPLTSFLLHVTLASFMFTWHPVSYLELLYVTLPLACYCILLYINLTFCTYLDLLHITLPSYKLHWPSTWYSIWHLAWHLDIFDFDFMYVTWPPACYLDLCTLPWPPACYLDLCTLPWPSMMKLCGLSLQHQPLLRLNILLIGKKNFSYPLPKYLLN